MPKQKQDAASRWTAGDIETWGQLNEALSGASEADCAALMALEKAHRCRIRALIRIHGRMNVVRAERERQELVAYAAAHQRSGAA